MSPVPAVINTNDGPAAPERLEDLQRAWAELIEAAKGSKVTNFHAYTRTGHPWSEDPAIRAVAATLREFPSPDSQHTT